LTGHRNELENPPGIETLRGVIRMANMRNRNELENPPGIETIA